MTTLGFGIGAWNSFNSKPEAAAPPKESASVKKSTTVSTTSDNSSTTSSYSSWLFKSAMGLAGAALVGGAGAAYLKRDDISNQWSWAKSHLSFVGELFSPENLEKRMSKLVEQNIRFHW